MKVQLRKWPSLDQVVQQASLLVEVAGLEEEWVEVKRHPVKPLAATGARPDEALSGEESQRLHVSWLDFQQHPGFQTADVGSASASVCPPAPSPSSARVFIWLEPAAGAEQRRL